MSVDPRAIQELIRQKKYPEALAACRVAIDKQPVLPKLHAMEGTCHFEMHNWAAAAAAFQKAAALKPDFWQAGAKLAQSLERMDRNEEALEVAQEFLKVQPNDHTLQGLIDYLSPMVVGREEGWERSRYAEYRVMYAGEDREEE